MMTLKSIYLSILKEEGMTPKKSKTYITDKETGVGGGAIFQKSAPQADSGWNYRGGVAGYTKGFGESDLPSDDEGQQDNEYQRIESET